MRSLPSVLFSPKGRINRREYWLLGWLPLLAVSLGLGLLASAVTGSAGQWTRTVTVLMVLGVFALLYYCGVVILIKRWHDLDRSGAWTFLCFIPLVGAIIGLVLGLWPGANGPNRHDINPKL